ncbi:MAG: LpxD N-terminal domain-containing protein, partial [Wolinella sp.]
MKLSLIAQFLELPLPSIEKEIIGISSLEGATPDKISFVEQDRYASSLKESRA